MVSFYFVFSIPVNRIIGFQQLAINAGRCLFGGFHQRYDIKNLPVNRVSLTPTPTLNKRI